MKIKEKDNIHLFPRTIPLRWHTVCWLSSSLFLVFVYFLLLQVSVSDRNWFPAPTFRVFYFETILSFIASVRCVEWANGYFWVIIAAMFVCLRLLRDDLCLSCRPVLCQWARQCSGFLLPGSPLLCIRNIIPFSGGGEQSLRVDVIQSPSCVLCPSSVPWCVVTMSDRNHLLWWDEGAGHSLSSNNCLCLGQCAGAGWWPVTWRGLGATLSHRSQLLARPGRPNTLPAMHYGKERGTRPTLGWS